MQIRAWFLLVFTFLLPSLARAAPTCDGNQPETCCEWWVIDINLDGKTWGAMLEHGYPALMKRRDSELDSSNKSCQYYRNQENPGPATRSVTHRVCDSVYSAPRCSGTGGVKKGLIEEAAKAESWTATQHTLREWVPMALEKLGQYSDMLKKISNSVNALRSGPDGDPNRYRGIGSTLLDYGHILADTTKKVHDLDILLKRQNGNGSGVYYAGGQYGLQDAHGDLLNMAASLDSVIDGLGEKIRSMVPTLGIPGFDKPRIDFPRNADRHEQTFMDQDGDTVDVHVVRVRDEATNQYSSHFWMNEETATWNVECYNGQKSEVTAEPDAAVPVCMGSSIKQLLFQKVGVKKPPAKPRYTIPHRLYIGPLPDCYPDCPEEDE